MSERLPSYPKVWNLGHPSEVDLFKEPVEFDFVRIPGQCCSQLKKHRIVTISLRYMEKSLEIDAARVVGCFPGQPDNIFHIVTYARDAE